MSAKCQKQTFAVQQTSPCQHLPFAERQLWNIRAFPASVRLDVGLPDHLGPLLGFVGDELTEVAGRASKRRATQISELCLDLGISGRRVDLLVALFDTLNGRVSRR